MAEKCFLLILNMSITASWVILVVLAVRLALRRLPAKYSYMLWAVVGFRLLCPVSVSTVFSIFNLKNFSNISTGRQMVYIPADIGISQQPRVQLGANMISQTVSDALPAGNVTASANPLQIWIFAGSMLWLLGIAVMLVWASFSLIQTKISVRQATLLRTAGRRNGQASVFECEQIPSPFVLGIIRPRIYIPYRLSKQEQEYILAHERMHIRRLDHWIKPLAFVLLCIHWFNPLVWVAYLLLCKDMEMSCDEAVLLGLEKEGKKAYSTLLLSLAVNRRHFSPGPLAFGESDVARRIRNVLRFRRPKVWMRFLGIAAVAVIAAVCMTNPAEPDYSLIEAQLQRWAVAFCERDGETILEMCAEEAQRSLEERELLMAGEDVVSFGMSSPWPWQSGTDYRIVERTDSQAVILYYAQTSDPHVTVWRETLFFEVQEESLQVTEEALVTMDYICTAEEFLLAYPDGINSTEMDYLSNGKGEALNSNAMLSSGQMYRDLFSPDRAAIYLLNLLDNPEKVQIRQHPIAQEDGSVELQIYFALDDTAVNVRMIQPYKEAGIWIPQNMDMKSVE